LERGLNLSDKKEVIILQRHSALLLHVNIYVMYSVRSVVSGGVAKSKSSTENGLIIEGIKLQWWEA